MYMKFIFIFHILFKVCFSFFPLCRPLSMYMCFVLFFIYLFILHRVYAIDYILNSNSFPWKMHAGSMISCSQVLDSINYIFFSFSFIVAVIIHHVFAYFCFELPCTYIFSCVSWFSYFFFYFFLFIFELNQHDKLALTLNLNI